MSPSNVQLMVPFVRTVGESKSVVDLLGPIWEWLMDQGNSSISLNLDTFVDTWTHLTSLKNA